jgi:hypothetical protein
MRRETAADNISPDSIDRETDGQTDRPFLDELVGARAIFQCASPDLVDGANAEDALDVQKAEDVEKDVRGLVFVRRIALVILLQTRRSRRSSESGQLGEELTGRRKQEDKKKKR